MMGVNTWGRNPRSLSVGNLALSTKWDDDVACSPTSLYRVSLRYFRSACAKNISVQMQLHPFNLAVVADEE
jgi:hypothetical protein